MTRVGAGVATVMGAAVILSACTGQQNASGGGQATTATATTSTSSASAPVDACGTATKATLEAALAANKPVSSSLEIDSKGLQQIKCAAPWAIAAFSNNIDGGSVVFQFKNGAWVATDGGTDVCDDFPAATAKQLCD